jgi:hypothetical protein
VAACFERLHHLHHGPEVRLVGRARIFFYRLHAERGGIFVKCGDVAIRVLAQRDARFLRRANRLVVHVGEVHDVVHGVAFLMTQGAPQDVQADECPEVADVTAGVHGQTARVHANRAAVGRGKLLIAASQGVVETHLGDGE